MKIDLTNVTNTKFKPTLFNVNQVLEEEVVGEHESRMSLFTNFICAERNCMLAGPRSSGKTFIVDHITEFVGNIEKNKKGLVYVLTAGSEKSGWYQADELSKCKYVVVLELNKLPHEMREILKDWGEDKDSIYRTTVQVGGVRRVKAYNLYRRPFVFCLADEDETKLDVQLASRLTIIRTDNSIPQNRRVMLHQAQLARLPENPLQVDRESKEKLKLHIMTLPPLQKFEWKHPAAELFVSAVPSFFTDCRRDFPKYLANTVGICRFYWKERIKTKINGKSMYFITPEDMFLNHVIYGKTIVNSSLKCNNIEREMMRILQESETPLKRADIQRELKKRGTTLSAQMTSRHLNQLVDLGYVEKENVDKKQFEYSLGKMFEEFLFEINWTDVIEYTKKTMKKLYKDIADDYIKRYCDEPIVIHPFTGEQINLLKLKKEKIRTSLGQVRLTGEFSSMHDNSLVVEEIEVKQNGGGYRCLTQY